MRKEEINSKLDALAQDVRRGGKDRLRLRMCNDLLEVKGKLEVSVSPDLKSYHLDGEMDEMVVEEKIMSGEEFFRTKKPDPEIMNKFDKENREWYKERLGLDLDD